MVHATGKNQEPRRLKSLDGMGMATRTKAGEDRREGEKEARALVRDVSGLLTLRGSPHPPRRRSVGREGWFVMGMDGGDAGGAKAAIHNCIRTIFPTREGHPLARSLGHSLCLSARARRQMLIAKAEVGGRLALRRGAFDTRRGATRRRRPCRRFWPFLPRVKIAVTPHMLRMRIVKN